MKSTATTKTLAAAVALAALSASAAPTVTGVTMTQKTTQRVEVKYTLNEDAVVTFDVLTNAPGGAWVSIGAENVTHVSGDVNKLVTGAGEHTLYWSADRSWVEDPARPADVKAQVRAWSTNAPPPYMVIDLEIASHSGSTTADFIRYYESADQLPDGGLTNDLYRTERLVMRRIPAKDVTWRMGCVSTEKWYQWGGGGKQTTHYVTLSEDYYMGVLETTGMQYHYFNPSFTPSTAAVVLPAVQATFNALRGDASTYGYDSVDPASPMQTLRTRTGLAFDLPTEAQWEYACRAGTSGMFSPNIAITGNNRTTEFASIGWCETTESAQTESNVRYRGGQKQPNAWGLYDMHGNVKELCLDWFVSDLGTTAATDPKAASGSQKVLRGGAAGWCWQYQCTSAFREGIAPTASYANCGFRLVCPAVAK